MSSLTGQRTEIKRLYEAALEIVEERNLYAIKQEVAEENHDKFTGFVHQSISPQIYESWWSELKQGFSKAGLNYLRFKKKVVGCALEEKLPVTPAGYFMFGLLELEAMIADKNYLDEYALSSKATQSWPVVRYRNGVIDNGVEVHDFNKSSNTDAIKMLNALWEDREIVSPTKAILHSGQPISWSGVGAKSNDGGKYTAHAINKAMRAKDIRLRIRFPKRTSGVYLEVQQKGTK